MECSPPGSSVHGISQARLLEWVAIFFSRGSSQPTDRIGVSCTAGRFFITEPPGKPHFKHRLWHIYLSFLSPCQDTEEVDSHWPLIFCTHWSAARWLLAPSMCPFMTCSSLFLFNKWYMSLFLKCDQWSHLYHGAAFVKTSLQGMGNKLILALGSISLFPRYTPTWGNKF